MAGHSKWKQIRHKKEAADKKRSALFSKLLHAITVAAREGGGDPNVNTRLKSAIEQAKKQKVPLEGIERAIARGVSRSAEGEEMKLEILAPGGVGVIVSVVTDNKNRTLPELKKISTEFGGKVVAQGSVQWMFQKDSATGKIVPLPSLHAAISESDREQVNQLLDALSCHPEVVEVISSLPA
ncbi:hypothetical protein D6779_05985 [Candidatus Parcubacteria bacterium]|nr:MAG: hypothetical protein D6779_05985 [Candidatus Parcubacteria bacterium]